MAGEWLAATANTNMFTYEIAPVFLMMENEVSTLVFAILGLNCIKKSNQMLFQFFDIQGFVGFSSRIRSIYHVLISAR